MKIGTSSEVPKWESLGHFKVAKIRAAASEKLQQS